MPNVNRTIQIGHLTKDPALKTLANGTVVAEFGLAMNERFTDQAGEKREKVHFVDYAAYGKQAEVLARYCKKGDPIYLEGRLVHDTWDDKNGGGKRSKHSIAVSNFQFLSKGNAAGDDAGDGNPPF